MKLMCRGKIVRYIWLVTWLIICAAMVFGQGSDKEKTSQLNERFRDIAREMKENYDNGDLDRVIALYREHCLEIDKSQAKPGKERKVFKKVAREIRADMYQWLALSYYALDRPEIGDTYLKKLLDIRLTLESGYYWPSIRKRAESKYIVAPRLLVGVTLGSNFSAVRPGKRYAVLEPASTGGQEPYEKDYIFHFNHSRGIQVGISAEYALTRNVSLIIQPSITEPKFQYKNSYPRDPDGKVTLEYTHLHKLSFTEIPVLLKYQWLTAKLTPYIQFGAFLRFLQSGVKKLNAVRKPAEDYKEEAIVDIKNQFSGTNSGLWLGAGIAFDSGRVRLQIEVNYKHGLDNIVDEARRRENEELMYTYYDIFDDMKLSSWDISLKVMLPISFKAFKR